ncbi:M23 family metallopeptidase [Enterovirga rhinocerotis]|uniref:Murein DD-endopeptidase MepM/ murein hydrolase activator NlpD n=1 Tax=Enterovirga rhinocerotis TaxID=1339210 RepID=A0A4R7BTL4_9HYPH|nr:M23 family metallopeptidase [Enterovirga rhinocerotis]TDR87356.1 murein DD-endopeptidase MepM/ murein hydrolase activator NlpD [Enterovirga rhinocerotis]
MSVSPLQLRSGAAAPAHGPRRERPVRGGPAPRFGPAAALGNEPPLDLAAPVRANPRHALSIRWLGASVLTALAGFLLIGSAIVVSQRGEIDLVEAPEVASASPGRAGDSRAALRKGDKLIRAETVASAKQSFRSQATLRVADREVIKMRSYTRLATALSPTAGVYATNVPPFNPLRFMSQDSSDRAAEPPPPVPEASDAEVSIIKTDLATLLLDPTGPVLSDQDVQSQVEAELRALAAGTGRPNLLSLPMPSYGPRGIGAGATPTLVPGLAPRSGDAAFRSIEVRVVPENVSTLPKGQSSAPGFEERVVAFKRGETLEAALRANGAAPDEARAIASLLGRDRALEGLQMRVLIAPPDKAGETRQLTRVVLYGERGIEAIAAMNDRRAFVSVTPPPTETARPEQRRPSGLAEDDDEEDEGTGAQLYASLYETAAKHEIPRAIVDEIVRVMGYDVDFQRRIQAGDAIEIVMGSDEEGSERQDLLSVAFTLGSNVHKVFRYQGEDGSVDYFDEGGRSLKKFLIRMPIAGARLTSLFGVRVHPILGYAKGHTGVDWAARVGTPIFAAGNGTVIKADWSSGYGRRIEIQHANGYVTTYNHQSAFARGITQGVRVRQGQVIGYVGSTGLSTGPHLHYEVLINGRFVDPLKIRVPRGRELDGRALADFNRQRDEILAISKRANPQFAASEHR